MSNLNINESIIRWVAIALLALVTIGFITAGAGILGSQEWWRVVAIVSSVLSVVLIVLFWHSWFVVGLALDAAILIALVWVNWPSADAVGS